MEAAEAMFAASKLPWRQVLASAIRRAVASRQGDFDSTYSRRNRRQPAIRVASGGRIVTPGSFTPTPTLVVVRDTSGSMGQDELAQVGSEIEAVAKQVGVRGRDLTVLDVDTEVAAVRPYQGPNSLREVSGRGGTDMGAGIRAAVAQHPKPDAVIVITDGYTPWPAERPSGVPVVVCLVGGGHTETPDWALTVEVETAE